MLKTYTLYLRDGAETVGFVPAMCSSDVEAMRRARLLLSDHPECETIEVFFGEQRLYIIGRASP